MSALDEALPARAQPAEILASLRRVAHDRSAAVAIYKHYEASLAAQGEEPDAEIVALYRAIVWNEGRTGVPDDTQLPRFATLFVGRRRELERLDGAICPGTCVVVGGPAGGGKGRLA